MIDAKFILILFFISPYYISFSLASIWLFHFTLGIFYLCVTVYTFSSCSSHTINTFSSKFLHLEYGSQCCNYTLAEPRAPKMHLHTPSTTKAFWGHNIEECWLCVLGYPAGRWRRLQEDIQLRRLRHAAQEVPEPTDRTAQHRTGAEGREGQRRDQSRQCQGQVAWISQTERSSVFMPPIFFSIFSDISL